MTAHDQPPPRPEPIPARPFPNMPDFTAEIYQEEIEGYSYASICSAHRSHTPGCPACQVGRYTPIEP